MSDKYQTFEPGKYLDWERKIIEERIAVTQGKPPRNPEPPVTVSDFELLQYNHNWDPHNPLFNDREYARKAGYQDVPAFPCFKYPGYGAIMAVAIPVFIGESIADMWYFAHGPNDVQFFAPIYPGDTLTPETEKLMFEELTIPGNTLRHFKNGCVASFYNQRGELVVRHTVWRREAYRKIIDGSSAPGFSERVAAEQRPQHPAHYTTDEEWEYIKELWRQEHIRGQETLYWEDVNIGDEPAWICSGPVSYMDMVQWHGYMVGSLPSIRQMLLNGEEQFLYRDHYGQYLNEIALMYGGKNIPGERTLMYNNTSANLIARLVTNYIGDAGFVTRIGWMFRQFNKEMQYPREGGEYLDKVPYMKGKQCTSHPSEADTVIARGYVTDKYINDQGEHIIDLVCWGETLDKHLIEVVPASAKLPSKG